METTNPTELQRSNRCVSLFHLVHSPDLRFLSIDFLNTFLLTYRVFTDGETVLNALKKVFYDPPSDTDPANESGDHPIADYLDIPGTHFDDPLSPRRTSGASSVSGWIFFPVFQKRCITIR